MEKELKEWEEKTVEERVEAIRGGEEKELEGKELRDSSYRGVRKRTAEEMVEMVAVGEAPKLLVGGALIIDGVQFKVLKALKRNRYIIGMRR